MRIVCAPDSFKGSLTAAEAAAAMARGVRKADPDARVDLCPIADGGEGTAATLVDATGGELHTATVTGPRGRPVEAAYGRLGADPATAVVEMAAASGLILVPPAERDPTRTTTFGTGELIAHALDQGARRIILAIGGSATHDGGCGCAQALGLRFLDARGQPIAAPLTGGQLLAIQDIDASGRDPRLADTELLLCCDVDNPLTGPDGAAAVYGPQKGASPEQVELLDAGLTHLGRLWRERFGIDVTRTAGAGAAGGMGGGMLAMLGARLRRGIDLVLEAVAFDQRLAGADLCLTGEGRLDGQSLHGKACFGVTDRARAAGVPVVGIFGAIAADAPGAAERQARGMTRVFELAADRSPDAAMRDAAILVEQCAAAAVAR